MTKMQDLESSFKGTRLSTSGCVPVEVLNKFLEELTPYRLITHNPKELYVVVRCGDGIDRKISLERLCKNLNNINRKEVVMNKIFKGLDYNSNTLAIIAVKDEDSAWVWATGSELPIHSFQEINPDLAKCVVLAKAAEYHTGDYADRLSRRRFDSSSTYILK